jgi:hypothetical protein
MWVPKDLASIEVFGMQSDSVHCSRPKLRMMRKKGFKTAFQLNTVFMEESRFLFPLFKQLVLPDIHENRPILEPNE